MAHEALIDPPIDDQEAKDVLEAAYNNVIDSDTNLFALGIAQAIGLMEGKYGAWGPDNASNNWGAITATPNTDGSCPPGTFKHGDSSFEKGQYQTCFRLYPTAELGAEDFLRKLYIDRPKVLEAALSGDIRGVAQEMYATTYYTGTAPHGQKDANGDFTNVNNYIKFIGKGVDQISDLYPPGGAGDVASGSNTGLLIGLGVLAVGGLALALK